MLGALRLWQPGAQRAEQLQCRAFSSCSMLDCASSLACDASPQSGDRPAHPSRTPKFPLSMDSEGEPCNTFKAAAPIARPPFHAGHAWAAHPARVIAPSSERA